MFFSQKSCDLLFEIPVCGGSAVSYKEKAEFFAPRQICVHDFGEGREIIYKQFVAKIFGNKRHYFQKKDIYVDEMFQYTAQDPSLNRARKIAETMVTLFDNNELDEVYIVYTKMKSAIATEPKMKRLLPLRKHAFTDTSDHIDLGTNLNNITLLPSADVVFDNVIPDFIAGYIYGALVESYCSEQNARMMAMQGATDSAKEMLKELSVLYNRARQAAITQEITEVISGAKAQRNKE